MRPGTVRGPAAVVLLGLFAVSALEAQTINATTYPFTQGTASLEDMSAGTTQIVGPNIDDTASGVVAIGFEFWYVGTRYTQFSCNPNGVCRLGPTAINTTLRNDTEFASALNNPKIAPYFDDLRTGTNGKVHFKVVGTAPSRKLVVEWLNMQIPRLLTPNEMGAGTFQLWLHETTGVIEFVYGTGIALNTPGGGYTIGLANGVTPFASVTSGPPATVSYATHNFAQTNPIAAGTKYAFTPPIPNGDPSGLGFTGITAIQATLNWTDNSTNEVAFGIYRSTDLGTTYSFFGQAAANATSFTAANLDQSTTYFWRVFAVTEGALSANSAGASMTTPAAPNVVSAASGLWSAGATWAGGVVPTSGDDVTIGSGHTVTIDTAAVALDLTVNPAGVLQFQQAPARTLTVTHDVTVSGDGTFQSSATGGTTTHVLSLGGNLTVAGLLDFSTNGNTAGAGITFTGSADATFTGSGVVDIRTLTVNKGTSFAPILALSPTNLSVRGVTTDVAGFLTLTNGTLKISGTFAMTNRVFATAIYTIPSTGGIWLDNPNFTVAGQAGGISTNNRGLFRVSAGTYNIGVGAGDGMGNAGSAAAVFLIEGGTVNASGRIDPQTAGVTYTQTGGTVNVGVVGNNRADFASFDIFNTTGTTFTMSGGTINLINRNTSATPIDFRVRAATVNVTGGTLVIGGPLTPAGTTFLVSDSTPSIVVNPGMTLNVTTTFPGTTPMPLSMRGTSVTNNGAIISGASNARFDFASLQPMTYLGSGTFGTPAVPFGSLGLSINSPAGVLIASPIVTNRVNLFQGMFLNSSQITLGNGGASSTFVQVGQAGGTVTGGAFDVSPTFATGTGGHSVSYLQEATARITGVEVGPFGLVDNVIVTNSRGVFLAGTLSVAALPTSTLTLNTGGFTVGAHLLELVNPVAGTSPTNLVTDFGSTIVLRGSNPGLSLPPSVSRLDTLVLNNPSGATLTNGLQVAKQVLVVTGTLSGPAAATLLAPDLTIQPAGGFLAGPDTLITGPWTNLGTFNANGGTVNFNGSPVALLSKDGGAVSTEVFCGLLIYPATTLDTTDDFVDITCAPMILGALRREAPAQFVAGGGGPITYSSSLNRAAVVLTQTAGAPMGNTAATITMHQAPAACGASPLPPNPVQRVYDVLPANSTGVAATLRLYFDPALEAPGYSAADLTKLTIFHCEAGGWTALPGPFATGSDASGNFVEADGVTSFSLFAVGHGGQSDLSVTKTDGQTSAVAGRAVSYTITVANAGPDDAFLAVVTDILPPTLVGATWTCAPSAGSTCTSSGTGNIADTVNIPASGSVIYTLTAFLDPLASGTLANTATVATFSTTDPTPGNDSATDTDTIVVQPKTELGHGSLVLTDLASPGGTVADVDVFSLRQQPYASYEVVVDEASGDVSALAIPAGPLVERMAPDTTTVLQTSQPVGVGPGRSLRWANDTASTIDDETIRVRSAGCTTTCGADDTYRLRAYETTGSIPRFNNAGTQVTILVLQNPGNDPLAGTIYFWSTAGALIGQQALSLAAHAVLTLDTSTVVPGVSGAITVAHDGAYGVLAGKATSLEPATGFTFDSLLVSKPR